MVALRDMFVDFLELPKLEVLGEFKFYVSLVFGTLNSINLNSMLPNVKFLSSPHFKNVFGTLSDYEKVARAWR